MAVGPHVSLFFLSLSYFSLSSPLSYFSLRRAQGTPPQSPPRAGHATTISAAGKPPPRSPPRAGPSRANRSRRRADRACVGGGVAAELRRPVEAELDGDPG